ncbi:MAG TPA: hypothetical protein VNH80_04300 [Burkholderiales bacterium]|nr:hypothetical protein [Burkholderiales bacterium]
MSVITLGRRSFAGPFLLPLWSAPKAAGVCAVLVPGWKLLTFRALHFEPVESFSAEALKTHPRYGEWLSIAGTEWNLYVATHELSFSTPSERAGVERELARDYKPEFNAPVQSELPADLRTLLLARAMRANLQE